MMQRSWTEAGVSKDAALGEFITTSLLCEVLSICIYSVIKKVTVL